MRGGLLGWLEAQSHLSRGIIGAAVLTVALAAILVGGADTSLSPDEHRIVSLQKDTGCPGNEHANVTVVARDPLTVRVTGQYYTPADWGELGYMQVDLVETGFRGRTLMAIISTTPPESKPAFGNASQCADRDGTKRDWMNIYNMTLRTQAERIGVYHDGRQALLEEFR